ncbi:IDEAL domain-containing protein [Neobacillus notoginsengisoli]|uniref:IDEAL domain-containing protein n=1 Tax=Neobacillus notoginsengisoli TaxID=1578198 RepID=A0A417YZ64_9BACI|nr:IDEAL domain-containing protein [Neobacillus notoginsengisoli]RHW43155.1 IDEAL domain-containing protein [Neobacillus notoginsengisoli]
MKEKSYAELMKIGAMKKEKAKKSSLQELYIEMLLNEIQLNIEKEKLLRNIDEALEQRNEKDFMRLSGNLVELEKRFGA